MTEIIRTPLLVDDKKIIEDRISLSNLIAMIDKGSDFNNVYITPGGGYGSDGILIIEYQRPETEPEMSKRISNEEARQEKIKQKELSQLSRLLKKYKDII